MKRAGLLLMILLFLTAGCAGAEEGQAAVNGWNLRINIPEGATPILKGNEYYLYAQHENSIPYVMVTTYGFEDAEACLTAFTEYMRSQYADLKVTGETRPVTLGEKSCFESGRHPHEQRIPGGVRHPDQLRHAGQQRQVQ